MYLNKYLSGHLIYSLVSKFSLLYFLIKTDNKCTYITSLIICTGIIWRHFKHFIAWTTKCERELSEVSNYFFLITCSNIALLR